MYCEQIEHVDLMNHYLESMAVCETSTTIDNCNRCDRCLLTHTHDKQTRTEAGDTY